MFKKFENMYVSQALLTPDMYIYGIGIEVPYDFKIVFCVFCDNFEKSWEKLSGFFSIQ